MEENTIEHNLEVSGNRVTSIDANTSPFCLSEALTTPAATEAQARHMSNL